MGERGALASCLAHFCNCLPLGCFLPHGTPMGAPDPLCLFAQAVVGPGGNGHTLPSPNTMLPLHTSTPRGNQELQAGCNCFINLKRTLAGLKGVLLIVLLSLLASLLRS